MFTLLLIMKTYNITLHQFVFFFLMLEFIWHYK